MWNQEESLFSTCIRCKKREAVYKKIYFERGSKIEHPVIYRMCQNKACFFYIKVTVGELQKNLDSSFEWVKVG